MTRYTAVQIATVAAGAGFTGAGLVRAVAVALAESGGDANAVGVNHDRWHSRDRGLWQINSHWHPEVSDAAAFNPNTAAAAAYRISKAGKDWRAWSTWNNGAALAQYGPARLAVARVHASSSTPGVQNAGGLDLPHVPGFPTLPFDPLDPWGVLPDPLDPLSPDPTGPGLIDPKTWTWRNPIAGGSDTLTAAKQGLVLAVHAGAWMADSRNWSRVAMVVGGGAAMLTGLYLLARSGEAGSTAAGIAATTSKTVKGAATAAALA